MTVPEQIARSTWYRLKYASRYSVRLGEETITDLLALDLRISEGNKSIRVFQSTKKQEAETGIDLLIIKRIRATNSAMCLAVQSKKLHINNLKKPGIYRSLNYWTGGHSQLYLLENFAQEFKCIPLYLLYNYENLSRVQLEDTWHCHQSACEDQLGCTFVPTWRIRLAIDTYGARKFLHIHSRNPWVDRFSWLCRNNGNRDSIRDAIVNGQLYRDSGCLPDALPWRCMFDCYHKKEDLFCDLLSRFAYNSKCLEIMPLKELLSRTPYWRWYRSYIGPRLEIQWPSWMWDRDERESMSVGDFCRLFDSDANRPYSDSLDGQNASRNEFKTVQFLPRRTIMYNTSESNDQCF